MVTMQDDAAADAYGVVKPTSGWARTKSIVSTAIGAIVAMSLLMALGIWFYRLGVRDAQNVPIIRAAAEPAKERPEDPGGQQAPHQNIESYEVASDQPASAAAVVVAPAPPSPKPEDVPLGEIATAPAPTLEQAVDAAVAEVIGQSSAGSSPAGALPPIENSVDLTGGNAQNGDTQLALADTGTQPSAEDGEAPDTPLALPGGTAFAPPNAPVAPRRPANLVQRTAAAADQAVRQQGDLARAAATSAVQIQLAANPSEEAMRAMWDRVSRANGDILGGRALAIQTTRSGGRTFYRLRVGPFRDRAEARSICEALKARGQECIVAGNG